MRATSSPAQKQAPQSVRDGSFVTRPPLLLLFGGFFPHSQTHQFAVLDKEPFQIIPACITAPIKCKLFNLAINTAGSSGWPRARDIRAASAGC